MIFPFTTHPKEKAFTLVEMLVASAISMLIVVTLLGILHHVTKVWSKASGDTETFGAAADAFGIMTRKLSQAVLNTYWSYDNPALPTRYTRASELHFVMGRTSQLLGKPASLYPGSAIFFQAPLGKVAEIRTGDLPSRLNALGFFTAFGKEKHAPDILDGVIAPRYRFRLYEWLEPTEDFSVYTTSSGTDWFRQDFSNGDQNLSPLGANIVCFFILAEYPLSDGSWKKSYTYDSRDSSHPETLNQLPPRLRMVLLAIDERSAERLTSGENPPSLAPPDEAFSDPENFDADLKNWENALRTQNVGWRIFSTSIQIPNSKWSIQ